MTVDWLTTSTILDGLRDFQNRRAWDRFVERFRRPVVRFAISAGLAPNDAEDVAQDALVGFAEALRRGEYDPQRGRLSRWLFGFTYRHVLRHRQKAGRQAARVASAAGTTFWKNVEDERAATETWDAEWERSIWQTCVEHVRPEFEELTFRAFELVVRDEMKPAEAAGSLGVPVKTVYNAKHRVLKRIRALRAEFEDVGGS